MDKSKQQWLTAFSVCLGGIMSSIDTFIMYVATPHLRGVFSATVAEIAGLSTSYAIASMLFMLMSAWLVRGYGARLVYQRGLLLFVVGSILCAAAAGLDTLIAARVVQGMGAGLLLPVEGVILRRTFAPSRHSLVLGLYGTTIMCGPAFGPMLGGFILDQLSWPVMFLVNVPLGVIGLIMVRVFVPSEPDVGTEPRAPIDMPGIALMAVGIVCLVWLLERGNRTFWFEDGTNLFLLVGAACGGALFFAHEAMTAQPLLDLSVLKHRDFNAANLLNFLAAFMITGTLFVLPIYMQEFLQFSPTQAGTTMAPRALVMMGVFPLVGWLFNRVPPRALIICGLLLGFASGVMMSRFSVDTGWDDMIVPQILQGIGAACVLGPVATTALMCMPKDKMASAAAIESTTRLLGSTIGIAVFASLLTHLESRTWELVRHDVSMSSTVLYQRFQGLLQFFSARGGASPLEKSFQMLGGRVMRQVSSLAYMSLFQLIAASFAAMLLISLFITMRSAPANSSHKSPK
jgi:DHA2 family multidrug resistance protein